jgi:hypothetical protein
MDAEQMAARVLAAPTITEPWPYATLDDFLPAAVFAELLAALPGLTWTKPEGVNGRKARELPAGLVELLHARQLTDAFAKRFAFARPMRRIQLEAAWFGASGLAPHCDRADKLLSAQVYLAGDAKGTELYDSLNRPAGEIEWAPNRLAAWTRPPNNEKHAAPKSAGRFVLLYWFMR